MNSILSGVIQSFDMVALCMQADGQFQVLGQANPWFNELFAASSVPGALRLEGKSLFLDNFLVDARQHWGAGNEGSLSSGPFLESGLGEGDLAFEARALLVDGQCVLVIVNLGQSYEVNRKLLQAARQNLLNQEILELEVSKRTVAIRDRQLELAARLIYAAGFRDEETGAHIKRIGLYSGEIAAQLGWSPYAVDDIKTAAPMHDIGKIGIPDKILKKPGPLSASEFTIMKTHASIGGEILGASEVPMIQMAAEIASNHHECWNGRGYPRGLHGEHIPEAARIVAIVDVYDALVHERVYKPALPEEQALAIMAKSAGIQFDPRIFDVFMDNIDAMRAIREEVQDEG